MKTSNVQIIFKSTLVALLLVVGFNSPVASAVTGNTSGSAWGGTSSLDGAYRGIGWIKFGGSTVGFGAATSGLTIPATDGNISGYGWSDNYGWLDFNGTAYRQGNSIKGSARFLSIVDGGWNGSVSLSGSNYGVIIAGTSLSGYAWSSELGWIDFSGVSISSGLTANISQDVSTTAPGGAVAITWNSSGASSCKVTKTVNGGASVLPFSWTSQPTPNTSGSATANPTVIGSHVFSIECTGADGVTKIGGSSPCLVPNVCSVTHVVSNAPTATLTQSSDTTTPGQAFDLTWRSSNATSCSMSKTVNGGASNYVTCYATDTLAHTDAGHLNGSCPPTPTVVGTHVFSFSCTGSAGPASGSVTHTVVSASTPTASLTASPASVASGGRSTLTWSSANVTSCTPGGPWSNSGTLSGSGLTDPLTSSTTFTLQCTSPSGTTPVQSATVTVGAPSSCSSGQAYSGGSCVGCSNGGCSGGGGSAASPLGSLSCNNGATDPISCSTFPIPAPTASLSAAPSDIDAGQTSKLTWSSTDANSCYPAGGEGIGFSTGGAASNSVGVTVSPTASATYGITCSGAGGSVSAYAPITVSVPKIDSLTATPSRVQQGNPSTIAWSASGVRSCVVGGPGLSSTSKTGSQPVTINSQSTFTITCQTHGAPITKSVTVRVVPVFNEF